MDKKSDPEGIKFYSILALVLGAFGIWHIIDGWVPQARWLERYPEFPATWYDMGIYEFYAYNRWTGLLLSIGAIVCAALAAHGYWTVKRRDTFLDEVRQSRRRSKT